MRTRTNNGGHLIVARDGVTYGELARAYCEELPPELRRYLFSTVGVADPWDDPWAHGRDRWWDPDWVVGPESVTLLETLAGGMIRRWPHAWLLDEGI